MTRVTMNRLAPLVVTGVLAGCGGDDTTASSGQKDLASARTVQARANIFGAGHDVLPAPGGGGSGVRPPVWHLPEGTNRVVTIPSATGKVTPISGRAPYNGPGGDGAGSTDVVSFGGISGLIHHGNGMFLVGVFLTDDPPAEKAPPALNFTKDDRFESLAPRIGQTFFVGDGKNRAYSVPDEATRLFLGFVDGYYYNGPPGWYDNNSGKLTVRVKMTSG